MHTVGKLKRQYLSLACGVLISKRENASEICEWKTITTCLQNSKPQQSLSCKKAFFFLQHGLSLSSNQRTLIDVGVKSMQTNGRERFNDPLTRIPSKFAIFLYYHIMGNKLMAPQLFVLFSADMAPQLTIKIKHIHHSTIEQFIILIQY